ncbi:non-reducing end alpha-L-arabinofuranosidase family hydrolase [Myceligenerans crystallogenes]|uniref:non-reducing end alpha-L-arabinofuranosidase n=1 Tax=Myceligenerans crystallogenes TaxID=316335 RepID=A0ABN2NPA9_9MICO
MTQNRRAQRRARWAAALTAATLAATTLAAGGAVAATQVADDAESFRWSTGDPVMGPMPDATHGSIAVKDPTVVEAGGRYHVFFTTTPGEGLGWHIAYKSFDSWDEADSAPITYLDTTAIGPGYRAAPQVFYFAPRKTWYLIYQDGNAAYSTTKDIADPSSWSAPKHFYDGMPQIIADNIGNGFWLDFWNICDEESCYLFSTDDNGHHYRSRTSVKDFPNGFTDTVIAKQGPNRFAMFEGDAVYKIDGTEQYLMLIEAFGPDGARMYKAWTADDLDAVGDEWEPLAVTGDDPFARTSRTTFTTQRWTDDFSHGELLRSGRDQQLTVDPCEPLQFLFQGYDPDAEAGPGYGDKPYQLGLATADGPNPISAMCGDSE